MCVIGLFRAVLRACLQGGGGPQVGEVTCGESPHLSLVNVIKLKLEIIMNRRVPHPHGNRL